MPAKIDSVVRIDSDEHRTHGWQARVWWDGRPYSKLFSDGICGGKRRAHAEAVKWVLKTERKLGKPHSTTYVYARPRRHRKQAA